MRKPCQSSKFSKVFVRPLHSEERLRWQTLGLGTGSVAWSQEKMPKKLHFIKAGTIHSAAMTYLSWLQTVYCYMYMKSAVESAAELKMSPQRSSWTSPQRSSQAPPEKSTVKSAVDFAVKVCSGLWTPQRTPILVDLWNRVHQKWTLKVHQTKLELPLTHVESVRVLRSPQQTWWICLGSTQVEFTAESNLVQLEPHKSALDPHGAEADSSPPVKAPYLGSYRI